jgi:MFS family permease
MFGRKAYGSIVAVYQLFVFGASAIGPIVAGVMYDHFRNYDLAFTIATVITGASIFGLLVIPRTRLELTEAQLSA